MNQATVRPDVRLFLDWLNAHPGPRLQDVTPEEARRMAHRMKHHAEASIGPLAVMRDLAMPGANGASLRMRWFDKRPERAPGPVMVFYHGGGFVIGDLDVYTPLCAEIARQIDLPVISVDYRLAPEHPWPAAPDDAEAAARWIAERPEVTGLMLAGDSAGGTLTIVTALALRDRPAAVPVLAQWPMYPAVSPGTRFESFDTYGEGYFLERDQLAWFFDHYQADIRHWRSAPLRIAQTGLPPTLVLTAALDPLADQGRAYVEQCRKAGVIVVHHDAKGTIHGFLSLRKALPSGEADLRICIALLKTMIAGELP